MPGAGKQAPEVQAQIKELLEAGFDPTTIHRKLKVGRSSIYRMKRCLQQHGTTYMPSEMNKKNGRPKVLTAEQELHNHHVEAQTQMDARHRIGGVWRTARRWHPRAIMETHPNLPLLENGAVAPSAPMTPAELEALRAQWQEIDVNAARPPLPPAAMQRPPEEEADRLLNLPDALREQQDLAEQMSWLESQPSRPLHDAQVDERQGMQQSQRPLPDQSLHSPYYSTYPSQVGAMVEHQLQREMGLAEVQRAM
ncbi:hypothetical protein LTR87_011347 [Friedmanniomyces endolithicus]|nr:hypothetical protein LTR87_011347 [Friedmanniomyces endolithicus]